MITIHQTTKQFIRQERCACQAVYLFFCSCPLELQQANDRISPTKISTRSLKTYNAIFNFHQILNQLQKLYQVLKSTSWTSLQCQKLPKLPRLSQPATSSSAHFRLAQPPYQKSTHGSYPGQSIHKTKSPFSKQKGRSMERCSVNSRTTHSR